MGRHSKFEEKIPYTHPVYGGWGVPIPWYEMSGPEAAHLYRAAALVFESLPPTSVLVRGIQAIEAWRAENWPRCSGPAVFRGLREIEVEGDVLHLVTDGGRKVSVRFGESGAEWCRVDFRRPDTPTGSSTAATEVAARFQWVKQASAELAQVRQAAEDNPKSARELGVTPESLEWDI